MFPNANFVFKASPELSVFEIVEKGSLIRAVVKLFNTSYEVLLRKFQRVPSAEFKC